MSKNPLFLLKLMVLKMFSKVFCTISSTIQRYSYRIMALLKSHIRGIIKGVVIAIISYFVINSGIYVYKTKVRDQIVVHPNKINLSPGTDWDITKVFEIKNRNTEQPFFSIWLKLYGKNTKLNFGDIEITTEEDEPFISEKVMARFISFDVVQLKGFDIKKRPCIYLILYRLGNNERRLFKIKKRSSMQDIKGPTEILLEVKDFSETPAQISSKEDEAALSIQYPESFTTESMSILVR